MMDIRDYNRRLQQTSACLAEAIAPFPAIGVIAGTGLGDLAGDADVRLRRAFESIPNFPVATVTGHKGELLRVRFAGRDAIVLQGRFHLYEGYAPHEIAFPLRALAECGLKTLILTNAAGGLNPDFRAGDIMLITDHLNLTGENPLAGPHDPDWGPRFPDMTGVYDRELRQLAVRAARNAGIALRQGTYVGVKGPSLETPAETRFFRLAGADAIGMSTVMEAIVAAQCGLRVLGLSVITNMNLPDAPEPTSMEHVIQTAARAAPCLCRVIHALLAEWPA